MHGGLEAGDQSAIVQLAQQSLIGEVGADSADQHPVVAIAQVLAEFFDYVSFASGVKIEACDRCSDFFGQSGIFCLRDAMDRGNEVQPGGALGLEHFPALRGEPVKAAAALAGLFDPATGDRTEIRPSI
jgi:hypothetical protein